MRDREVGGSVCNGSFGTSLRISQTARDQPHAQADQQQGPGELHQAAVEDIQLTEQEQRSQADEYDGSHGLSPLPKERRYRRNWRHARISEAGGRRIGRLVGTLPIRRLRLPGVGRITRCRPRLTNRSHSRLNRWLIRILRLAQVQPVTHFVQAQRVRQRLPIAPRLGRVEGLERLVENPGRNEEAEDPVMIGDADQHSEDHHMDKPLEELAVVHGAHARNQAQYRGCCRVGRSRRWRRTRLLIGLPRCRTGFAEKLPSRHVANAILAERVSARLTKGGCCRTAVIYAVHTVLPSSAVPVLPTWSRRNARVVP